MKIIRYEAEGRPRYGVLSGSMIEPLEGDFPEFRPCAVSPVALSDVKVLAPVSPSKIVAVGPNYHAHLKGRPPPLRPHYWIKPGTAVVNPGEAIERPQWEEYVCHESELAIIMRRTARDIAVEKAPDYILGYTCINDVTAANLLDPPAMRATPNFVDGKIYDTFAPLGPVMETDLDTSTLLVQCRVNGQIRQSHSTSDFIRTPVELVSMISHVVTLLPGDVIATGAPPGVAPFQSGDVIEVEVQGIGILKNPVRERV